MRRYSFAMAIFGSVTAVAMLPAMALVLSVLSFGLAAPVMVLCATVFAYGLCLLPIVVLGRRAWIISLALILALAVLPGWVAQRALAPLVAKATAADIAAQPLTTTAPRVVALVTTSKTSRQANAMHLGTTTRCATFCEALLRGGAVDVVQLGTKGANGVELSTAFALDNDQIIDQTPTKNTADVTFWVGPRSSQLDTTERGDIATPRLIKDMDIGRVTVTTQDAIQKPLARRTYLHATPIAIPFYLHPPFDGLTSGGNDGGLLVGRSKWSSAPFTLWDIALDLGIPATPFETYAERKARQRAERNAQRIALQNKEFTYARHSVFQIYADVPHPDPNGPRPGDTKTWLRGIADAQYTLTDADRDIVRKILDTRPPGFAEPAKWLFWKDDILAKEFFPRLIAEFERGAQRDDALILPMLERLRYGHKYAAEFDKHADAIHRIMQDQLANDPSQQYLGLVSAGHRFSIDEKPFMDAFPTGSDLNALVIWQSAVCNVPRKKLASYTDQVLLRVEPVLINANAETLPKQMIGMFRFLVAQGHKSDVLRILSTAGIAVDKTLETNIFARKWSTDSLCR